jgi:hypothetical protein
VAQRRRHGRLHGEQPFAATTQEPFAAPTRVFNIQVARPIAEFEVTFSPISDSHTIELRNFGQQANPVVHLLNGSMIQIGSAVPSKERVVLSADGSLSGIFLIVVRSRSASEPQTGELWIDGKLHSAHVVFTSGEGVPMERLSTDEKVMGIRPPLGPSGHIAYLITLDDLKILRRSVGNQTSLSPPSTQSVLAVYAGSPAAGEPSLANNFDKSRLALAYKGRDNIVRLRFRSARSWLAEQQPTIGGQPVTVHPNSSPALAYADLPVGIQLGEHLIGAFTDPQGYIQLYTPLFTGNSWARIGIPYDSMYSPHGRPVMAWTGGSGSGVIHAAEDHAAAVQPTTYGRFYILYLRYVPPAPIYHSPTSPVRMAMSYVDKTTGRLRIGLDSYFDNVWSFAYGMSLLTPSDGTLRAAVTSAVLPNQGTVPLDEVYFRPHADGISDLVYNNYDDWKTLAHDTCAVLVTYQNPPANCALPW